MCIRDSACGAPPSCPTPSTKRYGDLDSTLKGKIKILVNSKINVVVFCFVARMSGFQPDHKVAAFLDSSPSILLDLILEYGGPTMIFII